MSLLDKKVAYEVQMANNRTKFIPLLDTVKCSVSKGRVIGWASQKEGEVYGGIWERRDAGRRNLDVPPSLPLFVPLDVYHCDGNILGSG